jgi:Flp pilus assembly pilin Flp
VSGKKERGASSLEYLMLGAIIVVILGVVLTSDTGIADKIVEVFNGLFQDVADAAAPE